MTTINDLLATILTDVPGWTTTAATWTPEEIRSACEDTADLIASGGEMVLYGAAQPKRRRKHTGDHPPEPTAEDIAAAVARGLAILALAPTGVTVLGRHWCVTPHPDCPGPGPGHPRSADTSQQRDGAYYTPRTLAEEITNGALEPLVYEPGPLQTADETEWRLRSSAEIIALDVGDIAVGAGVFPVAAIRYLAARVLEAWTSEGVTGDVVAARRAVLRCIHGTDINAAAVDLAKVAVWLVTFDPAHPHLPLDRQFAVGDSLLGITNLQQLAWMHLDAERGKTLHTANPGLVAFPRHLASCVTVLTRQLMTLKQQGDQPAAWLVQTTLDVVTETSKPLADLATGAALASGGKRREWDRLSVEAAHLAATLAPPAREGSPPAYLTVPVVYAADTTALAGEWHIADPTTDLLPTSGRRDEQPRTWFMCGALADLCDVNYTRTTPDAVCGACQTQATQVNDLLGAYLTAAATALHTILTATAEEAA